MKKHTMRNVLLSAATLLAIVLVLPQGSSAQFPPVPEPVPPDWRGGPGGPGGPPAGVEGEVPGQQEPGEYRDDSRRQERSYQNKQDDEKKNYKKKKKQDKQWDNTRRDDRRYNEIKPGKVKKEVSGRYKPPRHVAPQIPYGTVSPKIPGNHRVIQVEGVPFYYYNGTYYQQRQSGYVVVQPPIGATISVLPQNMYSAVTIDGVNYYIYNGAYYVSVGSGYMVVPEPVYEEEEPLLHLSCSGQIVITSEVLNVRSCPGKGYPVIGKLFRGAVLEIQGHAKNWYFVRLPSGQYGWIHSRFTAPVRTRRADG